MEIKVFKFGGASVRDAEQIKNVGKIMSGEGSNKITLIVSAMGKTTNALEKVVSSYINQDEEVRSILESIKRDHFAIAAELFEDPSDVLALINDLFVEIEWILDDEVHDGYDYLYDQIVSIGELVSSHILNSYFNSIGVKSTWLDIRDILITDEAYREAKVNWDITAEKVKAVIPSILEENDVVVTQGFIGSTQENNTTTLGREGSDYSAGILSYCLDAHSMHIWKDVPGVLSADPAQFNNVTHIERLSYKEAVEMTYYGAKVIHPKTIKPLQNKSIPMYVRPFNDPLSSGTLIADDTGISYPPVIVIEPNQCLLHISTNDFSFVAEYHLSMLFDLLAKHRIKVNMMRNTAISFTISINHDDRKIKSLLEGLSSEFKVIIDNNLELITIRHYTLDVLKSMKKGKVILLEERLKDTVRMVVRDVPLMTRK
ncbi:MAG: aspartate kinase [Saprospiraceae bacterium]|nr:aspartate kinase [Saprospiraceae bacterium]